MKKRSNLQLKNNISQDLVTDCQCSLFNRPPKNNQSFRFDPNKNTIDLEQIHRTNNSVDHKKKISVSSLTKRKSRQNSLKNNQQAKVLLGEEQKQQKIMNTKPSIHLTVPQIQKMSSNLDNKFPNQFSQVISIKPIQKTIISTNYQLPRGLYSNQNFESKIESFNSNTNFKHNNFHRHQKNGILFNYGMMTQSTDAQIFSGYDKNIGLKIPNLHIQIPHVVPEESTFRSKNQQKISQEQNENRLYLKQTQSLYDQNEKTPVPKKKEHILNLQMETKLNFKTIQSIHNSLQNSRSGQRAQHLLSEHKEKQQPFSFTHKTQRSNYDNSNQSRQKFMFPEKRKDYSFF